MCCLFFYEGKGMREDSCRLREEKSGKRENPGQLREDRTEFRENRWELRENKQESPSRIIMKFKVSLPKIKK